MIISVVVSLYAVWQWTCHVPPLWAAWRKQLDDGVVFYSFGDGIWKVGSENTQNCHQSILGMVNYVLHTIRLCTKYVFYFIIFISNVYALFVASYFFNYA